MSIADSEGKHVDLEGSIIAQTDKAVFFSDGDRTAWLPKSQIEIESPDQDRQVQVRCPEWLAREEGLI